MGLFAQPLARLRLSGALAIAALPAAAAAQEYCVECSEPAAIYRCVIDNARPGVVPSLQVHCITRMAHDGPHGMCSIKRATVFECNGPVKHVSLATGAVAVAQPPAPVSTALVPAAAAKPDGPPRTVKELAERTIEKSGAQLKRTGEAVRQATGKAQEKTGSALDKTWACVSSFFARCN